MNKKWDYDVPKVEVWKECLRVLKPGGHALVACGTRTQHRMAINLEDAGFEIRDIVAWIYGSGFPKSLNIGKSVAKLEGVDIPTTKGFNVAGQGIGLNPNKELRSDHPNYVKPSYDNKYEGWGSNLKPAMELWTLCRKPLEEKTIASNVLKWGTGGINIDGCRVGTKPRKTGTIPTSDKATGSGDSLKGSSKNRQAEYDQENKGRFPANLIHSGEDEVVEGFPETKSGASGKGSSTKVGGMFGNGNKVTSLFMPASEGSASRFFYCAKASKSERNKGLEGFEEVKVSDGRDKEADNAFQRGKTMRVNSHPTVKPIKLMQYLCRLITPKGVILDPYMGSGSTGIGAKLEGFNFIGIEKQEDYCKIAEARIKSINKPML